MLVAQTAAKVVPVHKNVANVPDKYIWKAISNIDPIETLPIYLLIFNLVSFIRVRIKKIDRIKKAMSPVN